MMAAMTTRATPRLLAVAVVVLAVLASGCGGSDSTGDTVTGATARNGQIAPPGAPYSYAVPAGWHALGEIAVENSAPKTRYRSAVARNTGLIYVFSTARDGKSAHAIGVSYVQELERLGMTSKLLSTAPVDGNPAFEFDVKDVPLPNGGTARARRILIFGPADVVVVSCQWQVVADTRPTLTACADVRSSMTLS
jgi:hypothetical protein